MFTEKIPKKLDVSQLYRNALTARNKRHIDQPLYYTAKWWARRLAIVTNWIVKNSLQDGQGIILDPFMGSGTTIGEALRLGHKAIGIEINPFATILTEEALSPWHKDLKHVYRHIIEEALDEVIPFYKGQNSPAGYFWAYEKECSVCGTDTLLLKRFVVVKHAYSKKFPQGVVVCPRCRDVFGVENINRDRVTCSCGYNFSLYLRGTGYFRCLSCNAVLRSAEHNGYARLPRAVLLAVMRIKDGKREYTAPSKADIKLAHSADNYKASLPLAPISKGRTTNQLLGWGFQDWVELLHPRQRILALAISKRISKVKSRRLRQQLALVSSAFFEYHSRLASFKGIGTGAVRQAFSRPLLHPVSVSFEVDPTIHGLSGDPRSWYKLRTKPAVDALKKLVDERGQSIKIGNTEQVLHGNADVAFICADNASVSISFESVDAVITDPPYFNRVYYDDLAGAFLAWLNWCNVSCSINGGGIQSNDWETFSKGLFNSFLSATLALKQEGAFIFTFHHQDINAWVALGKALASLPLVGRCFVMIPSENPNTLIRYKAKNRISCDVVLFFRKGKRLLWKDPSSYNASKLAVCKISSCPEVLNGDIASAAYASGLVTSLQSNKLPINWYAFLRETYIKVKSCISEG